MNCFVQMFVCTIWEMLQWLIVTKLPVHSLPRRRDDAMQAHRVGFVATPTAELSNQEETLLGDILDWSLDTSCSGYEGDQEEESEGEKDADCKSWESFNSVITSSLKCV